MRKLFLTLTVIACGFLAQAQPPAGDANPGEWYGEKFDIAGALNLNDVATKLQGGSPFEGDTKIIAKVVEVCPKKGCWLKLYIDEKTTATVKMKDYGFFLPLAAKDKTVIIDGKVELKTISVAEQKHYAEDAGKSKSEIEAITEPKQEIRILAKGITVME